MAEISILALGDWLTRSVEPYLGFASKARRESVSRFRAPGDQCRSLWAELFARWRIAQATGHPPSRIALDHDEKGAPFCRGAEISLSISHSGPYVAVALGDAPLGADVERDRKAPPAVAARWFSPEENDWLRSLPEDTRPLAFFRLWTVKESALKYTGEGLSGGLEDVDALGLLTAAKAGGDDALAALNFPLPETSVAAIVAKRRDLPQSARVFTLETGPRGIYGDARFIETDKIFPMTFTF